MSPLAQKALEIAISQIGEEEKPRGSNWGYPVQQYLASVGINFPASWCMAFMHWCFESADKIVGADALTPMPFPKTGGVLNAWALSAPSTRVTSNPQPGDVFIMDFGRGLGHTGIIESIQNGMLHTIEGNTNDTGAREGFEVCRRVRDPKKMKGYLRF